MDITRYLPTIAPRTVTMARNGSPAACLLAQAHIFTGRGASTDTLITISTIAAATEGLCHPVAYPQEETARSSAARQCTIIVDVRLGADAGSLAEFHLARFRRGLSA